MFVLLYWLCRMVLHVARFGQLWHYVVHDACWEFEVLYGIVCAACCPNTAFYNHKAKDTQALKD